MAITATKKRKEGLTQYRVRVSIKQPDGSFRYVERTAFGMAEAKRIELELKQTPADRSMKLSELVALYNASRKGQIRQTTFEKADSYLQNHVLPEYGDVRIDALSLPRLQLWKNEMAEKNLSTVSKNNIYHAFSAVLNFGVKMEYLQKNNLRALGGFRDPVASPENNRFRYYTAQQFAQYIAAVPRETIADHMYYVFFMMAFFTGARKGEINALKWSDVDGDVIHIRRSVAQKVKGSPFVETPPKNKTSYRDVRMPRQLVECLAEHRALLETLDGFSEDWRVCGGFNILCDHAIFCRNEKYAKLAGLPRITIHEFRHSHASLLINAGVNIKEISRRLGHATVEMTWNIYSHLYPDQEQKVIEILEKSIP